MDFVLRKRVFSSPIKVRSPDGLPPSNPPGDRVVGAKVLELYGGAIYGRQYTIQTI
jgi:hypothetical protein